MVYFHSHYICEGKTLCPRTKGFVSEKACRRKCRYYYGRGIIKFVDDFDPSEPRVENEPNEHTISKWHICNYPCENDELNAISVRERARIVKNGQRKTTSRSPDLG